MKFAPLVTVSGKTRAATTGDQFGLSTPCAVYGYHRPFAESASISLVKKYALFRWTILPTGGLVSKYPRSTGEIGATGLSSL